MIALAKDWCRVQGCTLVSVVVTPGGPAAHHLIGYYGRCGFEETGRTLMFTYLD